MIVSVARTGTHLLAKLLNDNVAEPFADYETWHFSHSRIPESRYIHLYRCAYPVMLSTWRMREHMGVASGVTFSSMLRQPWHTLPKSTRAIHAVFNGIHKSHVCAQKPFEGTVLDRWLKNTLLFAAGTSCNIRYDEAVGRPLMVLQQCAAYLSLELKEEFTPVRRRVGWWADIAEDPEVSREDMELIETAEKELEEQWRTL